MYKKKVGGSSQVIEGIEVQLPKKPSPDKILFNHLKKKDQYWRRIELPIFRVMDIDWFSGEEPEDFNEEIDVDGYEDLDFDEHWN